MTKTTFGAGITILVFVVLIVFLFSLQNSQFVPNQIGADIRQWTSGDAIKIYNPNLSLPPQLQRILEMTNKSGDVSSYVPPQYTVVATQQTKNQTTSVSQASSQSNQSPITTKFYNMQINQGGAEVFGNQVTSDNPTFITGKTIGIAGQVTSDKMPASLTVTAQCCNMEPYVQTPHYLTDNSGNFVYLLHTTSAFPLGSWIVNFSFEGNDGMTKSYDYKFNLVER